MDLYQPRLGGDLSKPAKGKSPTFLVSALKDPDGANLDRVQIIKGWLDADGKVHEKIYDVAVSDGRKIVKGKVSKKVGSTVDLKTATYSNTIGDVQLLAGWTDKLRIRFRAFPKTLIPSVN